MNLNNRLSAFLFVLLLPTLAFKAGDKTAAIDRFQEMIDGCFGCHTTYKDRVANVLRAADHREGT